MATLTTTTADVGGVDVAGMRTRINNVRSRISANRTMRAQDIIDLAWVYNTWVQHTHDTYDYYWIAYGNKSPAPTSGSAITSAPVYGASYYNNIPGPGGTVKASDVANLVSLVDSIRSHYHTFAAANMYTAISAGYTAGSPYPSSSSGIQLDGVYVVNSYRSYHITLFDANGKITSSTNYDVMGNANNATAMANFMNSVPVGTAFVLSTCDEPAGNHLTNGLPDAAVRWGASSIFSGTYIAYRSAYMLIGHVGQAAALEAYTRDSIAVNFKISNNQFTSLQRIK